MIEFPLHAYYGGMEFIELSFSRRIQFNSISVFSKRGAPLQLAYNNVLSVLTEGQYKNYPFVGMREKKKKVNRWFHRLKRQAR